MKKYLLTFLALFIVILSASSFSQDFDPFFANSKTHQNNPGVFAIGAKSAEFIARVYETTFEEADKFVDALKANEEYFNKILRYDQLDITDQLRVLKWVFGIEVTSLEIYPPKFNLDINYQRAAFFEFDVHSQDEGTVHINPAKTFEKEKFASLSLLIHETRHSAQLQIAQKARETIKGKAYFQAFKFQQENELKLSFSDFLTLNNEYEAFLFANYVMFKIFGEKAYMPTMGTFASQFHSNGDSKLNLNILHQYFPKNTFEIFNIVQKNQKELISQTQK